MPEHSHICLQQVTVSSAKKPMKVQQISTQISVTNICEPSFIFYVKILVNILSFFSTCYNAPNKPNCSLKMKMGNNSKS